MLPNAAWVGLFFLAPLTLVVVYSLGQVDLLTFDIRFGWTLSNYRRIFDSLYLHTFVRSIVLSLGATLACLLVGFPVAYFISRQPPRWQRVLLVFVIVPFWASFIVRIYAVVNLLGNNGPIDRITGSLGVSGAGGHLNFLYSPGAVAVGLVYSYVPTMVLPIYVALERIEPSLLDAAADLGASARRVFWRVTLPLSRPGVIVGCIIVGIPALGEYVVPSILGGGKTLMLGNVISDQFLTVGDTPFGSAIAVTLMAAMSLLLLARRTRPLEAS